MELIIIAVNVALLLIAIGLYFWERSIPEAPAVSFSSLMSDLQFVYSELKGFLIAHVSNLKLPTGAGVTVQDAEPTYLKNNESRSKGCGKILTVADTYY